MQEFENNAIFWIETEKIHPNPYQPRKEFDEHHLRDLAESIRMYGVLQPLVVTRQEEQKEGGDGITVHYELIAGERRLRASKLAGVSKVPVVIRQGAQDSRTKLEIAIIENLQREDLNPVDRALAFAKLANEFSLKHTEIAAKVGKSREYVSNTLRLLVLPQDILNALSQGKITEGHARTLMMLSDRKEEQTTLFREILLKKLTVREAEQIARHIAHDKIRKKIILSPEIALIETELAESLGTRVQIEPRAIGGGRVVIDYFGPDDLRGLLGRVHQELVAQGVMTTPPSVAIDEHVEANSPTEPPQINEPRKEMPETPELLTAPHVPLIASFPETQHEEATVVNEPYDDRSPEEQAKDMNVEDDDELYSMKNFTV